jgi:hypothetical protein
LVSNFDVLKFDKSGSSDGFEITLNGAADTAGFSEIDATGVGSNGLILHLGSKFDNALIYTGSEKGDIVDATASDADTTVISGAGADSLQGDTAGTARNIWVYEANGSGADTVADSKIGPTSQDFSSVDTIENFQGSSVLATSDTIDLTAFDLTSGNNLNFGSFTTDADEIVNRNTIIDQMITGSFDSGFEIQFARTQSNTYLFVDANKDGNFSLDGDLVIKVTGTTAFSVGQTHAFAV